MSNALHTKVENALKATESFSVVLDRETDALQKADFKTFAALQDSKFDAAQVYQESILAFEEDVDFLKSLDQFLKEKLHAAHARFTAAAEANQKALLACKKVAERIVGLIIDAAKRTVAEAPNYGSGAVQTVSSKIPLHFKINEVL
jgi:hypothetical protein